MDSGFELLIEMRDDERPLDKAEAEGLVEELRSQELPDGITVSVRERRPGFGELGSLGHLWQIVLSHGPAIGGSAAGIGAAARQLFKILEKREEQTVILKGPGFELKLPARMMSNRLDELMAHVKEFEAKKSHKPAKKKTAVKKKSSAAASKKKHG